MQVSSTEEKVKSTGIAHIGILVQDLERSIKFYTGLLDMEVVRRDDDKVFLHTKGTQDSLTLFKTDIPIIPGGLTHFGVFVDEDNFQKAMHYIRKNNIKILPNPHRRKPGMYVYIEDPDGYKVEIST
ncbi:VOC family protein [Methanocella sp. CWC-04]|uniref:VOC family protein n=2 Tax=Methanooceanicella nereidis TaxID=2052831 RepID=A0AAP2RAW5_9EURY|nr:VOC family protein [Methanocella sp. CWC-04]MCD1293526.1 VOC family protein [Methanocella sp. CWC-04]